MQDLNQEDALQGVAKKQIEGIIDEAVEDLKEKKPNIQSIQIDERSMELLQFNVRNRREVRRKIARKIKMNWKFYQMVEREVERRIQLKLNIYTGQPEAPVN